MEATLTPIQKKYLATYAETLGNTDECLEACNMQRLHLAAWLNEPIFKTTFSKVSKEVFFMLKSENEMLAMKNLNADLKRGYTFESVTKTKSRDSDTGSFEESETQFKKRSLTPAHYALAMGKNTFLEAVETLAKEGVLSDDQAKRLLSVTEELTAKAVKIMSNDSGQKMNNEEKAVAALKQALIGVLEGAEIR